MTDLIWHRCSMCGERWVGTHQCVPRPVAPLRVNLPIGEVMRTQGEIDKLRAELAVALKWGEKAEAERDRAESELDAMRKARTEAEAAATRAEAERDEAVALIDAARVDVRAESFLGRAQAILAKCVAPYSCEQMKAVADALASDCCKLELVRELADKVTEERDDARAKLAALVDAAARVRVAEDVYEGSEDQSTDYQEVHRSTTDLWILLDAAIAAARGGAK